MTDISTLLAEAQEAFDSVLNPRMHSVWDDVQAAVLAQQEFRENILASQSLGMAAEATERIPAAFEVAQKLLQKLAPELEAVQEMARQRDALLASLASLSMTFCRDLDWSVIEPRPQVRMPSLDLEPSSRRTIVRPEVKRRIGF